MYTRYPFLFHFRDESSEDCWAVRDMAQQYLTQTKAYTSSKSIMLFYIFTNYQIEKSRDRYLRRNASGADQEDDVDAEEDEDKDEDEDASKGDYHQNMSTNRDRSSKRGASPASSEHTSKAAPTKSQGDYHKYAALNKSKERRRSTSPSSEQIKIAESNPVTSRADARDARRADKIVAREKEREVLANAPMATTAPPAESTSMAKQKDPKGKQRAQDKVCHG
jgi:hypothetical protein